jgi:hypothetical protein
MSKRDTGTGDVLEMMVLPSLERGGYECVKRTSIGKRPAGGKHIVDAIAIKDKAKILISLKWQQVNGTAEQKIPYEIICLLKALKDNGSIYSKAYVVLGGEGWTMRNFYVEGGLNEYLQGTESIRIVTFENFISLANKGIL